MRPEAMSETVQDNGNNRILNRLLAAGGLAGALLASSYCLVPLILVLLGVGGAWVSNLTALAPYQPWFILATVDFLGLGFWKVYQRPKDACVAGSYCASPVSDRVAKTTLWIAAGLSVASIGVNGFGGLLLL